MIKYKGINWHIIMGESSCGRNCIAHNITSDKDIIVRSKETKIIRIDNFKIYPLTQFLNIIQPNKKDFGYSIQEDLSNWTLYLTNNRNYTLLLPKNHIICKICIKT